MPEDPEDYASALAPPTAPLPHAELVAPLGVPTRIEADTDALLAAALGAYGGRTPPGAGRTAPAGVLHPATPRVVLLTGEPGAAAGAGAPGPLRVSADRDLLRLAAPDAVGRAYRRDATAVARLSPALLATPDRLAAVLDTLVLFLITPLDRQPVHAAAVAYGEAGLALAGRGGSGKSTLAYAALRAGIDVLGDDAVYVQLEPAPRAWTLRRPLHLAPDAAAWFPELAGRPAVLRANGKLRIAVPSPPAPPPTAPPAAPPPSSGGRTWGLCLLERAPGAAPAAVPITADEAVARVVADLEPGFDVWRETIGARIAALARGGAWRLRVGDDPHAAVVVIGELLGFLAR